MSAADKKLVKLGGLTLVFGLVVAACLFGLILLFAPLPQPAALSTATPGPTATPTAAPPTPTPAPTMTTTLPATQPAQASPAPGPTAAPEPAAQTTTLTQWLPSLPSRAVLLLFLAAGAALVQLYLKLNKKWKWKQEQPVAHSISIVAVLVAGVVETALLIKFALLDTNLILALLMAVSWLVTLIFFFIGIGWWVKQEQPDGFFTLIARALKLEWQELSGHYGRPAETGQTLLMLQDMAATNREIAPEEVGLVQTFARRWHLQPPLLSAGPPQQPVTLIQLHRRLKQYLEHTPSPGQAVHLADMLALLVTDASQPTKAESLMFDELRGLVNDYLQAHNGQTQPRYEVLLVPQNNEQIETIATAHPQAEYQSRRGGKAFFVAKFYSPDYAQAMCQRYATQDTFAAWVEAEGQP